MKREDKSINNRVDTLCAGMWEQTPTHCEVSWEEAKKFAETDAEWKRCVDSYIAKATHAFNVLENE